MKLNGRMSQDELYTLVVELRSILIGKFIKKIYHFNGKWLLKFNNISLVFEPGFNLWTGEFPERETQIHSVCIKIRKEITDHKIVDVGMFEGDRTIYFQFYNHYLFLEVYDKGNLILTDIDKNIIVLTRIYQDVSHKVVYHYNPIKEYKLLDHNYGWKKKNYEISLHCEEKNFDSWKDAISALWNVKQTSAKPVKTETKKKKEKNANTSIQRQITEFDKKITTKVETIETLENKETIDFKELTKVYTDKKMLEGKKNRAVQHLSEVKDTPKKDKIPKVILDHSRWYHDYHWFYTTKNNLLVVGGRNADQSEKLVKNYMRPQDLYFHSDEPGSGSFIMFIDKPDLSLEIDIEETAHGVISFSQVWKTSLIGTAYYVKANQVSKTAPSGEYLTKGSFMVYGERNYIKVENLTLGYGLIEGNQLMLAPYRIIIKLNGSIIRLTPKLNSKKNSQKELTKKLKDTFHFNTIPENLYIFSYPSTIFVKI